MRVWWGLLLGLVVLVASVPVDNDLDEDEDVDPALVPGQMNAAVASIQTMNARSGQGSLMPTSSGREIVMNEGDQAFDSPSGPFSNMEGEEEAVGVAHPDNSKLTPLPKPSTTAPAPAVTLAVPDQVIKRRVAGVEVDRSMPGSRQLLRQQVTPTMDSDDDDADATPSMQALLQSRQNSINSPAPSAENQMNDGMDEADGSASPDAPLTASADRMNEAELMSNGATTPTRPIVTQVFARSQAMGGFSGEDEDAIDSEDGMNGLVHSNGPMQMAVAQSEGAGMMTGHFGQSQLHAALATGTVDEEDEQMGAMGSAGAQEHELKPTEMNSVHGHSAADFNQAGRNPQSAGMNGPEAVAAAPSAPQDTMNGLEVSKEAHHSMNTPVAAPVSMPSVSAPSVQMPAAPPQQGPPAAEDEESAQALSANEMESYHGDSQAMRGEGAMVMPATTSATMGEGDSNKGPLGNEDDIRPASVQRAAPMGGEGASPVTARPMYTRPEEDEAHINHIMNDMDGLSMGTPPHQPGQQNTPRSPNGGFMDGPDTEPDSFMGQMNTVTKGLDMMATVASFLEMAPSIGHQYGLQHAAYAQPLVLPGTLMPLPSHPYGLPYYHRDPIAPLQTPYYHIPGFDNPKRNPALTPYYNPYVNPPPPVPPSAPAAPSFFPYHSHQAMLPPYFPYPPAPVIQPAPFPPYALPSHIEPGKMAPSAEFSHLPGHTRKSDPF